IRDPLVTGVQTCALPISGSDGCTSVDPGANGKLALIDRGTCTFSQKVANAKAAGAVAVVIINNVAGDPVAMARTAGFDDDLPAEIGRASCRGRGNRRYAR